MLITLLTVLAAVILGILFGCTSRNSRYFVIGAVAGLLSAALLATPSESAKSSLDWLLTYSAIFLVALFVTQGLRSIIHTHSPQDERADEYRGSE